MDDIRGKKLDKQIIFLYCHRVAVDHFILNPAKFTPRYKTLKGRECKITISQEKLKIAIKYTKEIYDKLKFN